MIILQCMRLQELQLALSAELTMPWRSEEPHDFSPLRMKDYADYYRSQYKQPPHMQVTRRRKKHAIQCQMSHSLRCTTVV